MVMRMGDSLRVSTGVSVVVPAVTSATPGEQGCRCTVPRLAGCRAVFGGLPSLQLSRTVVRHGSKQKMKKNHLLPAIRAAKSVDAPESAPSRSTSNDSSPAQSHLDLLERMTDNSTASQGDDVMTIRDQLSSQMEPEQAEEVVVPLAITSGRERDAPPPKELTVSQKRNIRRQNYLNKVSERNDAPFFAAVAGFVLVPPIVILAFAVATGYVEFFP